MSKPVISVKNIGKRYLLGVGGGERYRALRDVITNSFMSFLRQKYRQDSLQELWALKEISFDVGKGQKVGIIGRNGAGKSTLLKILSRITAPTEGEIHLQGRVASLLEVGTGFHPELTGRENVFMNGAILGMTKFEIKRKFDEIIEFAEVERFVDTPVKRYSSGMSVRLAFAVAAHLEPEILLVDEVLAVGDLMFQKKCMGKMDEVAKEGRTILFVSHNMGAVQRLCSRAILLQEGVMIMNDSTEKVVAKYAGGDMEQLGQQVWPDMSKAPGNDVVRIHSVGVLDQQDNACVQFDVRDPIKIEVQYWVLQSLERQCVNCIFYNEMGNIIFISKDNLNSPWKDAKNPKGLYKSTFYIHGDLLNHGMVSVTVIVEPLDWFGTILRYPRPMVKSAVVFYMTDRMDPEGARGNFPFEWYSGATVRPRINSTVVRVE